MKSVDTYPKAFAICFEEGEIATMMCTNVNVVEVELIVMRIFILI